MKAFVIRGLTLSLEEPLSALRNKAARAAGLPAQAVLDMRILRESLDARKGREPFFTYGVEIRVAEDAARLLCARGLVPEDEPAGREIPRGREEMRGRPVVAGLGPAGLFAALALSRAGTRPLVLERGRPMEEREQDFDRLLRDGKLDPESNVCFGEGGAGAFSDGKLTSRGKDPRGQAVLSELVRHGADPAILYQAKPHLGTENVRRIVSSIRREIQRLGGEVLFGARLRDVHIEDGKLQAITYHKEGRDYREDTNCCILATGHSARDVYALLMGKGALLEPKAFAIGARIEHPREFINDRQLGKWASHPRLGTAEYKLTAQAGDRGVYSFCMCPGGQVIPASTELGGMVVNGMSMADRMGVNSNSALVVTVRPEDFPSGILGGIAFQRHFEQLAYLAGGGAAPMTWACDLMGHREKLAGLSPSFARVRQAAMEDYLPSFVYKALGQGMKSFDRQIPGFGAGLFTGVETRTSAPLRILRTPEGDCSWARGLYPTGEGAGYAGGIVSAGVDGLRGAEAILSRFGRKE